MTLDKEIQRVRELIENAWIDEEALRVKSIAEYEGMKAEECHTFACDFRIGARHGYRQRGKDEAPIITALLEALKIQGAALKEADKALAEVSTGHTIFVPNDPFGEEPFEVKKEFLVTPETENARSARASIHSILATSIHKLKEIR